MKKVEVIRAAVVVNGALTGEECYEKLRPALSALDPNKVLRVSANVLHAISIALAVAERLRQYRDQAALLPFINLEHLDNLEVAALALKHAHFEWCSTVDKKDDLEKLNLEATKTREILLCDARSLVLRNLTPGRTLKGYRGISGYLNVANDLLLLVSFLRPVCDDANVRCACDRAELDRAEKLGVCMMKQVNSRNNRSERVKAAADARARAFTLVVRYYDTARRALAFLRWEEGDADGIAPSLFGGRRRGRSSAAEKVPAEQVPTGQVPAEQVPTGQVPADQVPADRLPAVQEPVGQGPAGQVPVGQVPAAPTGQVPAGQVPEPTVARSAEASPDWTHGSPFL